MGTLVQPLLYKKAQFLPQKLPIGGKNGKSPNKICFCLDQNKSIFRLHRTKSIQNSWEKLKTSNRLVKVELQKIKIKSHTLLNFPVSRNLTHMRIKELSNAQADLRDWWFCQRNQPGVTKITPTISFQSCSLGPRGNSRKQKLDVCSTSQPIWCCRRKRHGYTKIRPGSDKKN